MSMQQTISPVDGSVYAERPFADAARIDAVFAKACLLYTSRCV